MVANERTELETRVVISRQGTRQAKGGLGACGEIGWVKDGSYGQHGDSLLKSVAWNRLPRKQSQCRR